MLTGISCKRTSCVFIRKSTLWNSRRPYARAIQYGQLKVRFISFQRQGTSSSDSLARRWEYVKQFEQPDVLLPNTWIVVRIDGRGFTKYANKHSHKDQRSYSSLIETRFANKYSFEKPNDRRALDLMNEAAKAVLTELPELVIAYGISDEYSFVFHKSCRLFERRERYDLRGFRIYYLLNG